MQAGAVLDLLYSGKMSTKQKETFEKLWGVCIYLQAARRYAPESVLAERAVTIGSFMDDLDKQEAT